MHSHIDSSKTLRIAAGLLVLTFAAEFAGGWLFGSLSLLSDSFHVLSDLTSILVAFGALTLAVKRQPSRQMAFGYHRLEVLSALFNGLLLSAISGFIFFEAWQRFRNPNPIDTSSALAVALFGLTVNVVIALFFLRTPGRKRDLNLHAAYLHVLSDSLASVSVVAGLIAVRLLDLPVLDPIVAALISVLILASAWRVLHGSAEILLHKSPGDIDRLKERVLQIEGVTDLKDIRLWQVCSHLTVGTAHVVVNVGKVVETEPILTRIKGIIRDEFDIRDMTLECETAEMADQHRHSFEHEHD